MERPTTKCSVVQLDRPRPPLDKPRSSVSRDRHPHTATPSLTSYPCKPTFRPRRKRSTDRPSVLGFSQHEATENKSCFRQWTGSTLPIKTRYLRRKNKTVSPSDENQQSISPTPPQDRCAAGCLSLPLPRSPSRPSLSKPPPPRPLSPPSTPSTRRPLRSLEGRPRERPNPSLTTSDSSVLGLNQVPSLFNSGNVHPFPPGLFNQAPLSSPFVVDPSDDLLDDTTLYWGTDYSLIPSPRTPEMSERRDCNNGSTPFPTTIPFPSPFAEGFDDDSDSSDEMPSSIGSKSPVKIFREDMAIRKAKHRQPKSNNNPTSSSKPTSPVYSPSRSPTAVISSFQPHSLVDPFHPFPAYRLSHPAPDRASPWPEAPSSHYTAAHTHAPSPILTPAPPLSIPRRTLQQPHRLTASDCDLYVAFPQTSHYEVWDMDDDAEISCPVLLCIVDKGRYTGTGTLLAEPDVTLIELSCDDVPVPNTMIRYDRADEYSVIYNDVKTGTNRDQYAARHGGRNQNGQKPQPSVPGPRFIGGGGLRTDIGVRHLLPEQQHEIEVDGRWTRMYARPQPKRNPTPQSRPNPNANPHPSTSNSLSSISNGLPNYPPPHHTITPFPLSPGPPLRTHHDSPPYDLPTSHHYNPAPSRAEFSLTNRPPSLILTHALASGQLTPTHFADTGPARGFYLKLWIPIPLRLFQKRETRLFHIHARVWLNGDEEREGHVNVTERLVEGVKVEGGFPIMPGGGVGLGGDGGSGKGCGRRALYGRGHGTGGGTASTSWSQSPVENDEEPTSMPMPLAASSEMSVSHLRSWKCLSSW